MIENKTAFLSGKLNGTKTLENELNSIAEPDTYEKFLIEYTNLKFKIETTNEVIYINDDQDFEENYNQILNSEYVSLSINESFNRVYIRNDDEKIYSIRINKVSPMLMSNLISNETPKKFLLNSFPFVKWCNEKNIDIRNIYDIPTYIKILTNDLDMNKTLKEYIKQYTDKELIEDENELNNIILCNFIYEFGKYLERYINEFDLLNMCKLINENAYYESLNHKNDGECEIIFSYYELQHIINALIDNAKLQFKDKVYVLSPLGRIALKFGREEHELLNEIYLEDLEMLILNELYNNNIHVKLLEDNLYKVTCRFKNFSNITSLITAILTDVFYKLFDEKVKIKLECIVKE